MNNDIIVRRANKNDDLEQIAQLLYLTDAYIYPYWFENLDNCKKELSPLLLQEKFFFYIGNLFIAVDSKTNKIIGVVCAVNRNTDLSYDYSVLKAKNERYCFTIVNYIEKLIQEVKESDFAYISNVCVDVNYRNLHVGRKMMDYVIKYYRDKLFHEVVLDVLKENPSAIRLYQNVGFEKFTEIFKGFNNPNNGDKPDVFSMRAEIR